MRGWTAGICTLAVLFAGCESAEDKCEAALANVRSGLRSAVDQTTGESRGAIDERRAAMDALSGAVMDLGNIRSNSVVEAIGAHNDGAVGVEVSIGAMMAALLAIERLADDDEETAEQLTAVVVPELEGRYRDLMTWDVTEDGTGAHLAEVGDGCSTSLQTVVRELPGPVRSSVLARFTALQAGEGEPNEATDYARVTAAFADYQEARSTATATKAQNAAVVAALDGLEGPLAGARPLFDALPTDLDVGNARDSADEAWATCAEAGR